MATVLFSDIVGSTEQASRLGDRRWGRCWTCTTSWPGGWVEELSGQLVKTTGDRILAPFDGPGRGIRCAAALRTTAECIP